MRILPTAFVSIGLSVSLSGCLAMTAAETAVDLATLPVRVVSKGIDMATTSDSERDEKLGRAIRERAERLGKLERELQEQRKKCAKGSDKACRKIAKIDEELEDLRPLVQSEQRYAGGY